MLVVTMTGCSEDGVGKGLQCVRSQGQRVLHSVSVCYALAQWSTLLAGCPITCGTFRNPSSVGMLWGPRSSVVQCGTWCLQCGKATQGILMPRRGRRAQMSPRVGSKSWPHW